MRALALLVFVGAILAGLWLLNFVWGTLGDAFLGLVVLALIAIPFVLLLWAAQAEFSDEQRGDE